MINLIPVPISCFTSEVTGNFSVNSVFFFVRPAVNMPGSKSQLSGGKSHVAGANYKCPVANHMLPEQITNARKQITSVRKLITSCRSKLQLPGSKLQVSGGKLHVRGFIANGTHWTKATCGTNGRIGGGDVGLAQW